MVHILLFTLTVVAKQVTSTHYIEVLVINIERFCVLELEVERHIIGDEIEADQLVAGEDE